MTRPTVLFLVATLAASAWPVPGRGEQDGDVVPLAVQAAILKKVMGYDRALDGVPDLHVLVVHAAFAKSLADDVVQAFERVGLAARPVEEGTSPALSGSTVLYFLGTAESRWKEGAARAGSLTVSGDPELARRGDASVALRRRLDGRTEILVNLVRARAERHDFSSYLLTIASVCK